MSIKVNIDKLNEMSAYSKTIAKDVGKVAGDVKSLQYGIMDFDVSQAMNRINIRINAVNLKLYKLGDSFSQAACIYAEAEATINRSSENKNIKGITCQSANVKATDGFTDDLFKFGKDCIAGAGNIGKTAAFLTSTAAQWASTGSLSFGETGATSLLEYAKDGNTALEGLYEWAKREKDLIGKTASKATKDGWKALVGLDDVFSGQVSKATNIGKRFTDNFKNQIGDSIGDLTKTGKAAFEWAGMGLTVAVNAFSNIDEANRGGISSERAVAETVLESAIDIGMDVAVGAAIAAGVGAVCTAGAPVIVVAAGTAAVGFGLDVVTKNVIDKEKGRGFTEFVSDSILDCVGNAVTCKNPVPFQLHPIFHWGG
ncbi:hypothetical protein [Acetobacterium wieringae]|uniref:hypothetical protein n=1 Tax=Acetobacterium wieringae TaxID=52694 RepID=UPI003158C0B5